MDFLTRYSNIPTETEIAEFQERVLAFFKIEGRDFSWRRNIDPYRVLVSEIMLQQTQVFRVEPKFVRWMEEVPDFRSLSQISTEKLIELWQGLGYNRRALALRKTAAIVMEEHHGNLPNEPETLVTFPGIGPATAASICAFAFNNPVVFIETNIRRVFIHFFFKDAQGVADKEILPLAAAALYRESPRDWYNALMDLGTLLKSRVPNPNRKSRHYTRQAPFEGSNRQARGKILKVLQQQTQQSLEDLESITGIEPLRIGKAIKELEKEGFIAAEHGKYGLK